MRPFLALLGALLTLLDALPGASLFWFNLAFLLLSLLGASWACSYRGALCTLGEHVAAPLFFYIFTRR